MRIFCLTSFFAVASFFTRHRGEDQENSFMKESLSENLKVHTEDIQT
jgi:hypothetical protein